jgi:tetratricopeptide (TPR) repeat protein
VASPEDSDAIARLLHAYWQEAAQPEARRRLAAELPVPGTVALRARFHFLTDEASRIPGSADDLAVPFEEWHERIRLETEGDQALLANDTARARHAFETLRTASPRLHDRLSSIHGLIGLGDAARQIDEIDVALRHYEEAVTGSEAIQHRFGIVRALVPLGYLTLNAASATEAGELFAKAEEISAVLDERLYLANALIGRGETLQRRRVFDEGRMVLQRALTIAESLRSNVAVGNAAQRLADLELRSGRRDEAMPLLARATQAYEAAGVKIGAATAADSLADLLLDAGRLDEATEQYLRARDASKDAHYLRGEAHALTGLGKVAEAAGDLARATGAQQEALRIYTSLDDLVGRSSAFSGLARVFARSGNHDESLKHWLEAIEGVEKMRTLRERLDLQEEYPLRFEESYRGALIEAVEARDPEAFVTVFESLAGRRLAGLAEEAGIAGGEAELLGQLLARADQRVFRNPLPPERSREEVVRRLGAAALRLGLVESTATAFEDTLARAYRPLLAREESAKLLASPAPDAETLLLAPLPAQPEGIAWLWRRSDASTELGIHALGAEQRRLLEAIAERNQASRLRGLELGALSTLVPRGLAERLSAGEHTLLLLPLDRLWHVPWPALPLATDRFLGESAPLLLAPSLGVHAALAARSRRPRRTPRPIATWRSPDVTRHDLDPVFADDPAWERRILERPIDAISALVTADPDALVVVVCHGRPISDLGHYLELQKGTPLTPADVLNARQTPEELVLVSCWGATTPERRSGDPLTVATLALTRGSRLVAASIGELGDTPQATIFVRAFIHRLRDRPMQVALKEAIAYVLRDRSIRDGLLRNWAPLVILGSV